MLLQLHLRGRRPSCGERQVECGQYAPGVLAEALALAARMAELSPEALAAAKRLVRDGLAESVLAARRRESAAARQLRADGALGPLSPG